MTEGTFARRLRRYRRNARDAVNGGPLSQARLADLLSEVSGVVYSRGAISDWERDKGHIHKDARHILVSLIKVLHAAGGLPTLSEANDWLEAGNYRRLDAAEVAEISADWLEDAHAEDDPGERDAIFTPPALPAHPIVGRDAPLEQLKQWLFDGRSLALSAINGLPGIGKTALALLIAHDPEVRARFTDGILWVGLGPDPDVYSFLGRWAVEIGLLEEEVGRMGAIRLRANAIHEAIRNKRMLLVIDDVWDLDHAAHFRLGGVECAHVLTSRQPYVANAFAGEHALAVRELSEDHGLELLRRLAPRVIAEEPLMGRRLVRATGGLPLALVLVGNHLRLHSATGSGRRIRSALETLQEAETRFALQKPQSILDRESYPGLPDEIAISLRTVIGVSDERLAPDTRRVLRALSVFPPKPNTFSEEAALEVAATSLDTLDLLADHGLLEVTGRDRYTLHQSINEYARLAGGVGEAPARLADYYAAYVARHAQDHATLERELENVKAALQAADAESRYKTLWAMLDDLFTFLDDKGYYDLASRYLARLEESATENGPAVRLYLGRIAIRQGDTVAALAYWEAGLALARDNADHERAVALLSNLSLVASQNRDYAAATAYLEEAASHARAAGNWEEVCRALGNMGRLAWIRDAYEEADAYLEQALALAREHSFDSLASGILNLLGIVAKARGAHGEAFDHFLSGLHIAREHRFGARTSTLLANVGRLLNEMENYEEATAYLEEGLELARTLGDRSQESHLLMDLGVAAAGLEDEESAMNALGEAHNLAQSIENRWLEAYVGAHWGIAAVHFGRQEKARTLFERSLLLAPDVTPNAVIVGLSNYGLAQIALANGEPRRAARLSLEALDPLQEADHALAREVRAWRADNRLDADDEAPA